MGYDKGMVRTRLLAGVVGILVLGGGVRAEGVRETGRGLGGGLDHSVLDRFLKEHVRAGGMVDYLAVRRPEVMAELDAYLDEMAKVDDLALPEDERLALYCNLYNAVMIKVVAERYRVGFMPSEDGFRIFKEPVVRLGVRDGDVGNEKGRLISLDDLEHDLIRKRTLDPRIHAGIVCGAMDCPELVPEAYTGARVREQLEARMRAWLNSPVHTPVDHGAGVVRPSGLFVTYAADFGGREKVEEYIRGYLPEAVRGYRIEFRRAYDWRANVAKPTEGGRRYVYVSGAVAFLYDKPETEGGVLVTRGGLGQVLRVVEERDGGFVVEHPRTVGATVWVRGAEVAAYPPAGWGG